MKSDVSPAENSIETATCDYCGLPIAGPASSDEPSYCCYGCRFAAGMTSSDSSTALSGPASALGFSVFFTMNVIMLTMALWNYSDDHSASPFQAALGHFLRYGAMSFSFPVILMLGRPLASHALLGLWHRQFTTDLLLSTGVAAAFAVSVIHTLRGNGHVYFEVGCVILVLVTIGRWIEAAGKSHATSALDQLERLLPDIVRCRINDRDIDTPRLQVSIGDRLHIIAGERIPLDGRVVLGRGVVDEHFFTGESALVEKQHGDTVLGGSLNYDGDLIVEVTASPTAGALGRLVAAVRAARLSKGRYQLLSDAWSGILFPVIGVIAAITFVVHGLRVDWNYGLLTALSVVLIACPCALALATPLAVSVALTTAAKRGVLFRRGAALEALASVRAIRWDKTGTLTTGKPHVLRLLCEHGSDQSDVEHVSARIVQASNHVYSQAIRDYLSSQEPIEPLSNVQTVSGCGLRVLDEQGQAILLGSVRWMDDNHQEWGQKLSHAIRESAISKSPIAAIGYQGQVRGLFVFNETIRAEAKEAIQKCHDFGLDQAILTGDRWARASELSSMLGLRVEAELLPHDKLNEIRKAHDQFGTVAMIGDGLNDAPALAGADIGIALGCGADVCRESADICLLAGDLRTVAWAYEFSHRTVRTIRANLAWSFGYNSLGVIMAASGQLHPAAAAALMVVSSLMVLGNSLRLAAYGSVVSVQDSVDAMNSTTDLDSATPAKVKI